MTGVVSPLLFGIAGLCISSALHHGLLSRRRPEGPTHLAFALLCVMVGGYIVTKALGYHAGSSEELVTIRRWEAILIGLVLIVFPHFVGHYTGVRPRWLLLILNASMIAFLVANLFFLPYGSQLIEFPQLQHLLLPWGEEVVDLREPRQGFWHAVHWAVFLTIYVYCVWACVRQYRGGARYRASRLAAGMSLFMAFCIANLMVDLGVIKFIHLGEFGFVALVPIMSLTLTRELRDREQRMLSVLQHVPAVVYLKDTKGRYLWGNRRHADLIGEADGMVAGKTDFDIFSAAQAETIRANDLLVATTRNAIEFEEYKGERTFTSLKFPVLDGDGALYAVCGISTDVTDLRKAQYQMQLLRRQVWHADRVVRAGTIAASLAHELSQPLAAILCNAQAGQRFLSQGTPDLEELRDILQDIVRDDKRAGTIIAGLRSMLRQQETPRESVDLGLCVAEMLNLLHSECLANGVEVHRDLTTTCMVKGDKSQLQQVLLNLVMNAMEAMEEQPVGDRHLIVTVQATGEGMTQIAVSDDGPGLPEDMLEKVFDGFYTTKAKGLGIGLAVCRSIVEAHGGEIWAERNAGRGATFLVALPLQNR